MDWVTVIERLNFLSWPITVLMVVIFFRTELKGLMNRIINVEFPGGIKLNSPTSQKLPKEEIPKNILDSASIKRERTEKEINFQNLIKRSCRSK